MHISISPCSYWRHVCYMLYCRGVSSEHLWPKSPWFQRLHVFEPHLVSVEPVIALDCHITFTKGKQKNVFFFKLLPADGAKTGHLLSSSSTTSINLLWGYSSSPLSNISSISLSICPNHLHHALSNLTSKILNLYCSSHLLVANLESP